MCGTERLALHVTRRYATANWRQTNFCGTTGKLVFHIFAALAEFEGGLIIERTREGMKAARARGVRSGPKPKLSRQQIEHTRKLIEEGQRHEATAALFNISRVTLYRALLKAS